MTLYIVRKYNPDTVLKFEDVRIFHKLTTGTLSFSCKNEPFVVIYDAISVEFN